MNGHSLINGIDSNGIHISKEAVKGRDRHHSNTGRGVHAYLAPPGKKGFFFFLNTTNLALSGYLSGFGCLLGNHTEDFNRWAWKFRAAKIKFLERVKKNLLIKSLFRRSSEACNTTFKVKTVCCISSAQLTMNTNCRKNWLCPIPGGRNTQKWLGEANNEEGKKPVSTLLFNSTWSAPTPEITMKPVSASGPPETRGKKRGRPQRDWVWGDKKSCMLLLLYLLFRLSSFTPFSLFAVRRNCCNSHTGSGAWLLLAEFFGTVYLHMRDNWLVEGSLGVRWAWIWISAL